MGGWGGSAHYPDPTAQSAPPRSASPPSPPPGASGGRFSQPASSISQFQTFIVFVGSCCFLSRWSEVMLLAARACPRLGLSAKPAHSFCLTTHHCKPFPTRRLKADGPLTTIYVRMVGCFIRYRDWLSQSITHSHNLFSLRMTSVICFAGDALPQCYVPPIRCKGEWVPVAALLPNASAMFNSMQ